MVEHHYEIVLYRGERRYLPLETLATYTNLHPNVIECFVEYGLIEPAERIGKQLLFDDSAVLKVQKAMRLRSDLGINLAGIAVILDLVDRVRQLQREIESLHT